MNLTDVFFVCLLMYVYLTIILRLFGKKEFSQLNVFDFVVFLVIAEIMTISIGSDTISFGHSIVATLTLIFVDRIVSLITLRYKKARDIFDGKPSYIVKDGKIDREKMKKLRYTIDDLSHHLRVNGVDTISEVAFAVLETNGSLSVIKKSSCMVALPTALISDGTIDDDALNMVGKDQQWLIQELEKQGYYNYEDILYCILEKKGLYVLQK